MGKRKLTRRSNLSAVTAMVAGLLLLIGSSGCGEITLSKAASELFTAPGAVAPTPAPIIVKPFETFTMTTDQNEIRQMTMFPLGQAANDYGFDEMNNQKRGQFRFDSAAKKMIFERSIAAGDVYQDYNLLPADSSNKLKFKMNNVKSVSSVITSTLGGPNSPTLCGIVFGFGDSVGTTAAPLSGVSLNLGNRNWLTANHSNKNAKDYVRFFYAPSTTNERIVIDTAMNTFNYDNYTNFTSAEWRESAGDTLDLINDSSDFTKVGDTISFRQTLTIDSVLNTITVTIEPLSSNVDMTGWKSSHSVVWQFDAPISTPDAYVGGPRRGFDLSNVYGAAPMLMSDFLNQTFQLGFSGNGSVRRCEFADLKVTVKN